MTGNETQAAVYRMNPAEDRIIFSDELTEGMWVLAEVWGCRTPQGGTEDEKIRAQRFRRVTRLSTVQEHGTPQVRFVGEWVDGYSEVHFFAINVTAWLVKKDPPGDEENPA